MLRLVQLGFKVYSQLRRQSSVSRLNKMFNCIIIKSTYQLQMRNHLRQGKRLRRQFLRALQYVEEATPFHYALHYVFHVLRSITENQSVTVVEFN
jgi:hypothetical protein